MRPIPALLLAGTVLALPLGAQRTPRVEPHSAPLRDSLPIGAPLRLRVRPASGSPFAPDGPSLRIGTFAGWRADTLLVRLRSYGPPAAVPPDALRSLDLGLG